MFVPPSVPPNFLLAVQQECLWLLDLKVFVPHVPPNIKKKVSTTKITLMYCNMKNVTINSFENLAVHAVQFSFLDVGSSHSSFDLFGIECL